MDTNELTRPASWRETLLALGPFLVFTVLTVLVVILTRFLGDLAGPAFGIGLELALVALLLLALLAGWIKSFPRWVFPYWGFALTVTLYHFNFSGTIWGRPFTGDWRVWIPLGAVVLLGTLWVRSLRPIYALLKSLWKDWTLLSFAFYGVLPLMVIAAYDEVRNDELAVALINLILGVGAAAYMRTGNIWHRFASLVGGFSIGWLALVVHQSLYWNGRQLEWMPAPGNWMETLRWTSQFGATLMLILVAPVLVWLLRRAVTSRRTSKPA